MMYLGFALIFIGAGIIARLLSELNYFYKKYGIEKK